MLTIKFHQSVGKNHLVGVTLSEGSALVYFHEHDGSLVPVEIRLSSKDIDSFSPIPLAQFITDAPDFSEYKRISSHQIRQLSLSDVATKLRAMINEVAEIEVATGVFEPTILIKANGSNFGFRNTRDFNAAKLRLQAAVLYVNELHKGNKKPLLAISQELNVSVERARALIAGARREEYLTSDAPGTVGGSLTQKGKDLANFINLKNEGE